GMTLTPTEQLRANLSYNRTQVNRPSDGSRVVLSHIPRARVEYQLSRALQLRLITEYVVEEQDDLRDNSRSERPIVFTDGSGGHTLASAYREARMRADVLLTYLPNPGTVMYLGYGSTYQEPSEGLINRRSLQRTNNAFFLKLSYLFRMQG